MLVSSVALAPLHAPQHACVCAWAHLPRAARRTTASHSSVEPDSPASDKAELLFLYECEIAHAYRLESGVWMRLQRSPVRRGEPPPPPDGPTAAACPVRLNARKGRRQARLAAFCLRHAVQMKRASADASPRSAAAHPPHLVLPPGATWSAEPHADWGVPNSRAGSKRGKRGRDNKEPSWHAMQVHQRTKIFAAKPTTALEGAKRHI